mmetsp:Transcript_29480/g.21933  ORF Transcript_29480/g.21933 Transcript_29480/m.21933 type:complete len:124 (+) Transcript_29480:935-1306(+)
MNARYQRLTKKPIQIQDLGSNFSFQAFANFLTSSISQSVSNSTQVSSLSLQNKLLSLTSEGKYDSVDLAIQLLKGSKTSKSTSNFGAIREEDELEDEEEHKLYNEEQVLEKLKEQDEENEEEK